MHRITLTAEFPAFAADTLGETLSLTYCEEWDAEVESLAKHLKYGPDYNRAVIGNLRDMSLFCERSEWSSAAIYLGYALSCA